ncbi:hypothetical protein SacmaDRAFT_4413 [Saccharomonospora marina XMU15]|uniref:Uncharacterized protein n=1 Tax=Saccharomonospora marina XMU15 TaxID=882083 RepID=H5X9W1_9PSEU|nr:hypothetical protein [Saccharomonospora marina]EHR52599.1 hypothetical protein SacmaDRAFT_4413 [Saccharomonospora marina XMU15]
MNRSVRRFPSASALGLLIMMLLGAGVLPAAAATKDTQEQAAGPASDGIVQALVVGSTAFAMIIAVAGGVLFYTAKGRRRPGDPATDSPTTHP